MKKDPETNFRLHNIYEKGERLRHQANSELFQIYIAKRQDKHNVTQNNTTQTCTQVTETLKWDANKNAFNTRKVTMKKLHIALS